MFRVKSWVGLAAFLCCASQLWSEQIFSPTNALWRFFPGRSEASAPDPTTWRTLGFDDSGWAEKPAVFWYGDVNVGTQLADMQSAYSSFFLRRTFTLDDASYWSSLTLRAMCDDGFVAWVNGVQVASLNAPVSITYDAFATTYATEPVSMIPHLLPPPEGYLRSGANVLAIQVFNASMGSSDIVFDAELSGERKPDSPLTIERSEPPAGVVTNGLTWIRVVFSEAVQGVRPGDLLVNGVRASGVSGSGAVYTWVVVQPAYGSVYVNWSPQQQITTVAAPIRALLPSTPGVRWMYELVDPDAPHVRQLHPPANAIVRLLGETTVWFDKAVMGVDATDLLVDGQPATNVIGVGAGPYTFSFPAAPSGAVELSWSPEHGIASDVLEPVAFVGTSWSCTVNPELPLGDVVLNEILPENYTNLQDEEGDGESWIELFNRSPQSVNLDGWSLSDDAADPNRWTFPSVTVPAQGYLLVFASAKDRRAGGGVLHTNFKLSQQGEFLGLFSPDAPRQLVDALSPGYPEQGPDYSYGRTPANGWRSFAVPSPRAANGDSPITNRVEEVRFSLERGFYAASLASPIPLALSCPTLGATIRYTLDGSVPQETSGLVYARPIAIDRTRMVRAVAFKKNHLPSRVRTHTYLCSLPASRRLLPALSLVTATNNLYGKTGIMETNPRNTTKHGVAWERPTSVEWIRPEDNGGFQVDCGLRVAGGGYIRELYNYRVSSYPEGKYSFRLYFKGDYGTGRLHYRVFPGTTLESFNHITLRAGMNDPSNPFLRDELARQLESDTGQVASHGTFVNLFLNGVYKGYYNPAEHIDDSFLTDYHGGGGIWDIVSQSGEVNSGDAGEWNSMRTFLLSADLTNAANYQALGRRLDLTNVVDYLLPLIYADTDDWPHNNWRAARERVPGGLFRFYAWDAEWSFGFNNSPSHDTIAGQLSSTSPPWGDTVIQEMFNRLKRLPEFRLLFADRVHRHFFNGGALTDERIRARYNQLKGTLAGTISSFNDTIGTSWIPNRRRYLTNHFYRAGFLASSNAPVFSQFGGRVPANHPIALTCLSGTMYYTTDGTDPRVPFTAGVHPHAFPYTGEILVSTSLVLKARTLSSSNWSALTEATFQVEQLTVPLRITEIMYHPLGGDAYEYLEIQNVGGVPLNLEGYTLEGIEFRFPEGFPDLAPGGRAVLASDASPALFAARYPGVTVAGYFSRSLANSGERVALLDPTGRVVCSVTYDDAEPWPAAAGATGRSLELVDLQGDPNDPANWQASTQPGGTPGQPNAPLLTPLLRLNEIVAAGPDGSDWIELFNAGTTAADLSGWSISDDADPRRFVFPNGTSIASQAYLLVACDSRTNQTGLHTGFGLDPDGETLALYDTAAKRVDAFTFGALATSYAYGRVGSKVAWELCEPTPGARNEAATLAPPSAICLNEFLANPLPGDDDWIEIHNRDPRLPASLLGCHVATSNALFRVPWIASIAPAGFVVVRADHQAKPNHLEFTLPAAGGLIALSDATGTELQHWTYGRQTEGVSSGCLPDGSSSLVAFPASASPGASNYLASWNGPIFSEFMARNGRAYTNADGRVADWVELYNPQATAFDLSGVTIRIRGEGTAEWRFPTGTTMPGESYLLLVCDGSRPASTDLLPLLNTGISLNAQFGSLQLVTAAGQVVDAVDYGFQIADRSVGRIGASWLLQSSPTPGTSNSDAAALGQPANLRLNEWMAHTPDGDDWFEVVNLDSLPVDAAGCFLSDDPSLGGRTQFTIGPLTFIPPRGVVLWHADGQPNRGADHVTFSLDAAGEALLLLDARTNQIDAVYFPRQTGNASEGRWPDGAANIVRFLTTPSPGESNYLPLAGLAINELLTHAGPPFEDAIELRNRSAAAVAIGGWYLSDSADSLRKYRIPDEYVVPGLGYVVFYQCQFGCSPDPAEGFSLDAVRGGALYLSAADANGELTGYRDVVRYGAAFRGVPFGRIRTSQADDLAPLTSPSFGVENPESLAAFRAGRGAPNAPLRIGPVVLTELHYHPITGLAPALVEDPDSEFVELYNFSNQPVPLFDTAHPTNTWRLNGGVDYSFPTGFSLPAQGTVLVVRFDPVAQPQRLANFRARFALSPAVLVLGGYNGRLSDEGDYLELLQPDSPRGAGQPDAGFVPYVRVDWVDYQAGGAWPAAASGTGLSLQRLDPALFGNEPLHWCAAAPTPGTAAPPISSGDSDADGLPDAWESRHGLDPRDPNDADLDPDGDGFSNRQEWIGGTAPDDATSVLLLELEEAPDEWRLRFIARAARSYSIECTDDLVEGSWILLQDIAAGAGDRTLEFSLELTAVPAPCYFRLVTPGRE